jgi:hypothetical protein
VIYLSKDDRNAAIYARRREGVPFYVIAQEFNLARETVREISRRMERKARWQAINCVGKRVPKKWRLIEGQRPVVE